MTASTFIRRAPHDRDYVVIANATVRDDALTWGARGLLAYLLSLPDDWKIRQADLEGRAPEGKRVVVRLMAELEEAGYLRRRYTQTAAGRAVEVWAYEQPDAQGAKRDLDERDTRESTARSELRDPRPIEEVPKKKDLTPTAEEADLRLSVEEQRTISARPPDLARVVFDAWAESTGRTRTVLDQKRRRLIEAMLKVYPVEDLLKAATGWKRSAFHRGENDKGRVYNDLELIFRDAHHVEQFRDYAEPDHDRQWWEAQG